MPTRSYLQTLQENPENKPAFLTADGSVTQELWERMTAFGYGTSQLEPNIPIPGQRIFRPEPEFLSRIVQLIMAANVEGNDEGALVAVSKGLARNLGAWTRTPEKLLVQMRFAFDQNEKPISAPPKSENPLLREFLKIKVVEEPEKGNWPVTTLGITTMPFIFDLVLSRKGFDWKEFVDER